MAHQIAPAFDDLHLVPPLAKRVPDVVVESILEPQRAGLLAPGSPEEPARRLDRRLWIESAIDDARDEGRLRLRLALAAHGAVDEARTSVDEYGWMGKVCAVCLRGARQFTCPGSSEKNAPRF